MTKKFEVGKTYSIKNTCGAYTYVEELKVEEIVSTGSIYCTCNFYCIDANGNRHNGNPRKVYTRVRKAPGKDYQMTSDLCVRFYAV